MLKHLKSLPLTILLTVLIWMYAEAQFTATQPDVPLSVRMASVTPDFAVRAVVGATNRYTDTLNVVVTLQGPKNQIDRIYQEAQGAAHGGENRLGALTYNPTTEQLRQAVGGTMDVAVLPMLNRLDYFRTRGVTVTFAVPDKVTIEVDSVVHLRRDVVFQSPVPVDSATLDPGRVEVLVPTEALQAIGEDKIKVIAVPQNDAQMAALPPETDQTIAVRFVAEYPGPRDERIRMVPGQGNATVRVRRMRQAVLNVADVPIWVSGPPGLLARYDVEVTPRAVTLVLSGPSTLMETARQRLTGGPAAAGMYAYLDLTPQDKPEGTAQRRTVRYVVPDGLTLLQPPADVTFKLSEKLPATAPAAATGTTTAAAPANGH